MVRSMTGFGRCEHQHGTRKFTVELKSVNHRYFDVNIKMPKKFGFLETEVRNTLKAYIERGKVDVYISCEDDSESNVSLKYNESLAADYLRYYQTMAETFHLNQDIQVSLIGRSPEVLTLEEQPVNEDEIWTGLETALRGACERFVQTRTREGEALKKDMIEKLDHMLVNVSLVEERYPDIVKEYRQKLEDKVHELLDDVKIDENRLAAELVIFSDKICTDEETVRLRSHIETMKKELLKGGGLGRKLDFIAQEMNREANTILSKANDLITSNIAIDLKTEIEKIREQIQNIE